jgi:hypothetical protein
MMAHLSKYRSLMPSLALILHEVDCKSVDAMTPVTLVAAKQAAAWCDYLEPHARRIYHPVTARAEVTMRLLAEKIKAGKLSNPFTVRDAYRPQWTGLSEPTEVQRAAEALEDLDWLRSESVQQEGAGRPLTHYHINPKVVEQR